MPFGYSTDFKPPPRSNLRERLLEEQARKLREFEKTARMLQDTRVADLSPLEVRLNEQYIRDIGAASERLEEEIVFVRQQSAAEDEFEADLAAKPALERSAIRPGYYRSGKERNAAIAGILQRIGSQQYDDTRAPSGRVQARAAARRKARSAVLGLPQDFVVTDPCEEYRLAVSMRRQVLFAKGKAGRGYRTPHHSRKPVGC